MQANLETIHIVADFPIQIEEIVRSCNTGYMDAVELWCNRHGKDVVVGADLVKKSPAIKEKIKIEADKLNLLRKN